MSIFQYLVSIILAYLLGSLPTGLLVVRLTKGKDIRKIESGRTGATNTLRAAGVWAGLVTWITDVLKAAVPVWLARTYLPGQPWLAVLVGLAAIIGHNYSAYLFERTPDGKWRTRGGAGGAPCIGGILAFWPPSILIIVPIGGFILYFIGYASVGTISVAVMATIILVWRVIQGDPWEYIFYGLGSILLLGWALRPNFIRLIQGNERVVGFRARNKPKTGS